MDLFGPEANKERLPLDGGDVLFWRHVNLQPNGEKLYKNLLNDIHWEQKAVLVWGEEHMQPRLTAWYGDPGKSYKYSGSKLLPLPWNELLLTLRTQVENICEARFNSVLLNQYRNNQDSMGLHSDDEPELGKFPVIASLSVGAERVFTFKHKKRADLKSIKIKLPSESLLLMAGPTQENWRHGIAKQSQDCGPRINLTFRQIL